MFKECRHEQMCIQGRRNMLGKVQRVERDHGDQSVQMYPSQPLCALLCPNVPILITSVPFSAPVNAHINLQVPFSIAGYLSLSQCALLNPQCVLFKPNCPSQHPMCQLSVPNVPFSSPLSHSHFSLWSSNHHVPLSVCTYTNIYKMF